MAEKSLDIEAKRQILFSSLLKFSPETTSLREKTLDRVIIGGLLGSSEDVPYRIYKIKENLRFGTANLDLRTETIQESLERLIAEDKVRHKEVVTKHCYYLTPSEIKKVDESIVTTSALMNKVVAKLVKSIGDVVTIETATLILKRFMFECFAMFGSVIAKNVGGHLSNENLLRAIDSKRAFVNALKGTTISGEAQEAIFARCISFLKSADKEDELLKFQLTQGYFFSQLLGIENTILNPLAEHTFTGSVFYLDANVVMLAILHSDEKQSLFGELVKISKRVGVEIKVTRATINELRSVAHDRVPKLNTLMEKIPTEIIHHTEDQIVQGFLVAYEKDNKTTVDQYVSMFDDLFSILRDKWGIEVDDRDCDEILQGRDFAAASSTINDSAKALRGWEKSGEILKHDVTYYCLISDLRPANTKSWFLTRDRSLMHAASKLAADGSPFSFSFLGFLHSISAFLSTSEEETSFVEIFGSLVTDQIMPDGPIFEVSELLLMAEFHEDVLKTPAEQILMAFEYVKETALKGKPYHRNDIPKVSLELKKFLAKSKDEQHRALLEERTRLEAISILEREKRESAERRVQEMEDTNANLSGKITDLEEADLAKEARIEQLEKSLSRQASLGEIQKDNFRMLLAAFSLLISYLLFLFKKDILSRLGLSGMTEDVFGILLNTLAVSISMVGAQNFIQKSKYDERSKNVLTFIVVAFAVPLSGLFSGRTSPIADYIEIISSIVNLIGPYFVLNKVVKSLAKTRDD